MSYLTMAIAFTALNTVFPNVADWVIEKTAGIIIVSSMYVMDKAIDGISYGVHHIGREIGERMYKED